ncbi:kinase-like domain-containing protein [Mycena galopus ATCC 62051]|nr:kinase-like domain-containing protein [Mycena galopus ATCC 62051]
MPTTSPESRPLPLPLQQILDGQSWSPLSLSSHSVSTEYFSNTTSPYSITNSPEFGAASLSQSVLHQDPPRDGLGDWAVYEPSPLIGSPVRLSPKEITWSQPIPLESDPVVPCCEFTNFIIEDSCSQPITETPTELRYTLSQEEVDQDMVEMTCGPKLEEHFWPIRYQIRHGKLHAYENATHALIVYARKTIQPAIVSKLTSELASCRVCSHSSLAAFLEGSLGQYERLSQIAAELRATNLKEYTEAVWEDNLMIMLVFHEMLASKADLEDLMKLQGKKAQFILDLTQNAISTHSDFVHIIHGGSPRLRGPRRTFLNDVKRLGLLRRVDRVFALSDARRFLVGLSEACDLLPSSLTIHGLGNTKTDPVSGGGFADVYKEHFQGNWVALKRLRVFQTDGDENLQIRRKFCREALIWKNLDHDYVLPFLGVDSESFPGFFCMVSPWMNRGSVVTSKDGPEADRIPVLMHEIAVGLQYLHSQNVVHGDLRGANILLDDQGHIRLADFGLAVFADGPLAPTNRGGSTRWMAPELLDPSSCGLEVFQRTFASDVYSFACVCLEMYTRKPPFAEMFYEGAVLLKVVKGDRPEFPPIVPDWCSQLMSKCWSHIPVLRPGTENIIESILTEQPEESGVVLDCATTTLRRET